MDSPLLPKPQPLPPLSIPSSSAIVNVRVIDTKTLLRLDPPTFWQPALPGFGGIETPVFCFLVSHGEDHVIFDLGVRSDWEKLPPKVVSLVREATKVTEGEEVASILDSAVDLGIRSRDVKAVIWSHTHFDHIGNISTFPSSTSLVVGPGVRDASWPGWPVNPESSVLDSDIHGGRAVHEVSFSQGIKIGRFDAFDYFGDGSFYLLDAPGHSQGHMCALARTTPSPAASFVFMGADACHHAGVLRPSVYMPLPRSMTPSTACPVEMLQRLTMDRSPCQPFFTVSGKPIFQDRKVAMDTVVKIQELDASDHVLVVLGHDASLTNRIPLFPESINDWKGRGLRTETKWAFCQDFEEAVRCLRSIA